jgi:hypothetical protein
MWSPSPTSPSHIYSVSYISTHWGSFLSLREKGGTGRRERGEREREEKKTRETRKREGEDMNDRGRERNASATIEERLYVTYKGCGGH